MPKRDVQYMAKQRKEIASSAFRCLLKNGLHGTNVRDICRDAGVSASTFYIHFSSKEEVVDEAIRDVMISYDATSRFTSPTPITTWEQFIEYSVKQIASLRKPVLRKQVLLGYEIISAMRDRPADYPVFVERFEETSQMMSKQIQILQEHHEIDLKIDTLIAAKLMNMLFISTIYRVSIGSYSSEEEIRSELELALQLILGRHQDKTNEGVVGQAGLEPATKPL